MDTSLSTLVGEFRDLLDSVDPETGELPVGLDQASLAVHQKALSVAAWVQQTEAEADMVEAHAKSLLERVKTARSRTKWLKGYLAQAMVDGGIHSLASEDKSIRVQVLAFRDESVQISPGAEIPDGFMRVKITKEPDKTALKEAIIKGEPVPDGGDPEAQSSIGDQVISDETISDALAWLSENARKAAKARAERIYLEAYTKHLVARIARKSEASSMGDREKDAYASQEYLDHLAALQIAVESDEYFRWQQVNAEAKIEAWRSEQANRRAAERVT